MLLDFVPGIALRVGRAVSWVCLTDHVGLELGMRTSDDRRVGGRLVFAGRCEVKQCIPDLD